MKVENYSDMKFVQKRFTPIQNKLLTKHSDAEAHFEKLLKKANFYYRREKGNYRIGTEWVYYDFYIPYYRMYIEIDGESHQREEQKEKDRRKDTYVKNGFEYIARFTNEEVLEMEEIDIETIIVRSLENRKGEKRKNRRRIYSATFDRNLKQAEEDCLKAVGPDIHKGPIWLYDNRIGSYFEFKDVFEAKINTQLAAPDILKLLDYDYIKSSSRRFVFGWTLANCEINVSKTYY